MSWYIRVVSGPVAGPLALSEVKAHCRVDYDDDDDLIEGYISAAQEIVEQDTNRALMEQTLELGLNDFPRDDRIRMPRGQFQSVTSFKYIDTAQQEHTLTAGTDFLVSQYSEPAELVLPWDRIWPSIVLSTAAPVRIQFVAGWPSSDDVPVSIKQAMLMLIGDWYVNREDVVIGRTAAVASKLPNGVDRLLFNHRLRNYTPYCG